MTEESPTQPASDNLAPAAPAPPISVWTRIKDHKIAQWTLAYAAAAYALLDGTKIVSDTFEWPHLVARTVTVLLFLGLPLVVTLAWYHGHRALRRVSGAELTIITVLLVIASAVLWHLTRTPKEEVATTAASAHPLDVTPAVPISSKSIAVLPFVDMSEKHDQEYFSDGLSEELIDHLAHIPDLKVIARTSSFAFKGTNEDMRSIAAKLGVANLLEGSVRKAGEQLRITAQLIRARDGVHLWSEIYDRRLTDIFRVQDEISTTVANALSTKLNAGAAVGSRGSSRGTSNIEAYNLLLEGNYYYARFSEGDFGRAARFYKQALALDPNYALAWAKLALVYSWGGGAADVKVDVQRALAIDPNCAEAYFARGNLSRFIVGDWAAATSDYARAVALDPHSDAGDRAQGYILEMKGARSGRFGEYIDWARRRLQRDPLDTETMSYLSSSQQMSGHLEESVATSRRLLEISPNFVGERAELGVALMQLGRYVEALAITEKESDEESRLTISAVIYWALDRRAESTVALKTLEHAFADSNAYEIAQVHAYRGEVDTAFTWLDRAYQKNRGSMEYVKVEPLLRNLHGDPRFDALLRRLKLVN